MRYSFHLASSRVIAVSLRKVGFSSPRALHYLHVQYTLRRTVRGICRHQNELHEIAVCLQLSLRNILLRGAACVCVCARALRKRAGATIFRGRAISRLPYIRYASNIIGIHFADFWGNHRWIALRSSSEETARTAIYSPGGCGVISGWDSLRRRV